jgi:hypothetical protein
MVSLPTSFFTELLPAPLEMPDKPVVSLFVWNYTEVHPWP